MAHAEAAASRADPSLLEPEALDIALDCAKPVRLVLIGAPPGVHPDALRHLPARIDWLAAESGDDRDVATAWARRARGVQPRHAETDFETDAATALPAGSAFLGDDRIDAAAGRVEPATGKGFGERFREYHEKGWPILYAPYTRDGEEAFAVATLFALLHKTSAMLLLAPQGKERHEPVYRDLIKYRLPIIRHNRLITSFVPRKNRIYYIEDDTTAERAFAAAHIVLAGGTLARAPLAPLDHDPTAQPEYWEQVLKHEIPAAGPGLEAATRVGHEAVLAERIGAARDAGWLLQADDPETLAKRILAARTAPAPRSAGELRATRESLRRSIQDALS